MNQSEIKQLKERLEARTVAGEDHPIALWIVALLWAFVFIAFAFI